MEWVVGIAMIVLAWFWSDSMRARQAAHAASKSACEHAGLQLLDDTVAVASLRLTRDPRGRVALRRVYVFEFTDTGDNRRAGSVTLLRAIPGSVELEPHRIQ